MKVPCKKIPTYNALEDVWSSTSFDTQEEFGDFLMKDCFKEPGEYGLSEYTQGWNKVVKFFEKNKEYTLYSPGVPEYNSFWDFEKKKCRLGLIWIVGERKYYLTRDYYFLLNYCPVLNKEKGNEVTFMDIRDVQYHMMLYEKIAEIKHKHSCILKKRQMAFSICHTAKAINWLWFENNKTIKIFASDKKYLNGVNGCWKMVDLYRNHLNKYTDWERVFSPGEYPEIKQVEKVQNNKTKRWDTIGNESTLSAITLGKDVVSSVGGAGHWYWHEEGGVAPDADEALMYIDPALEVTSTTRSGSFCIGGSVGDLDQCKPLEEFMKKPEVYNFLPTISRWMDDSGTEKVCGLFIPTQYGMVEASDQYGNTQVEKALKVLDMLEEQKKLLPADKYAIWKSQNPRTMKQAFAWRKISEYDTAMIERQQEVLKLREKENSWEVRPKKCLLYKDDYGKIKEQTTNLPEEMCYPVDPTIVDKRGNVIIYEEPDKNAPMYTYFAGVDPVEADFTTTSESLFSISIWKRPVEEEYIEDGKKKFRVKGDSLVAVWRGRFDGPEETNAHGLLLMQMYNAYALIERNKPGFINYVRRMGWGHMIAKEGELPAINKDNIGGRVDNSQLGFYKGANGKASETFKEFKKYFREYFYTEYNAIYVKDKDGNQTDIKMKVYRGIDRIPDYWFLEELKLYNDDNIGNFDRIISDLAGYYIMKVYSNQMGITRISVQTEKPPENPASYIYNYLNAQNGYTDNDYNYLDY